MSAPEARFCAHCGASAGAKGSPDPLIGRKIAGAYILGEVIAVGGMGRVYRAEQAALGRTVAVKVIHPHLLNDEQVVARFYTEAKASSRLNHPNSVSVIDFGSTDDGILFLVMEYIQGKDLAEVMHEEGPLAILRACDLIAGICGPLAEAHELGVVHRDLKPENIIVRRFRSGEDLVKVVDFGLATVIGGKTSITSPGLVCGTPDYMSPEQARGFAVDGRSDLYSLGVMLFELLADRLPFLAEVPTAVALRHIADPVPDPRDVAPHREIPESLVHIVFKAMEKDPEHRYQTAEEMKAALREARVGLIAPRPSNQVMCVSCGHNSLGGMRFCGVCGARLPSLGSVTVRPSLRPRPSLVPAPQTARAIVGRHAELNTFDGLLKSAQKRLAWLHVSGEPGTGKTRLLREFVAHAESSQVLVLVTAPHASRAPVPYAAVVPVVSSLLDVAPESLEDYMREHLPSRGELSHPLIKAAMGELAHPRGVIGADAASAADAVAELLALLLRDAYQRFGMPLLLVADDFDKMDRLSRDVFLKIAEPLSTTPMMLITAGVEELHSDFAVPMNIGGLGADQVASFFSGEGARGRSIMPGTGNAVLPLYLEQVQALGASGPDDQLPPRLADAVAQRLDRLSLPARRAMQAAAVLGDGCHMSTLAKLLSQEDCAELEQLRRLQLMRVDDDLVEICHPFVRDIVEASTPAETRRDLHTRALDVVTDEGAPLEVRAEHAFKAGEFMSAMVLLERMGDQALRRGDAEAAVLGFQRALELARREMLGAGDPMLEGAIVTFSRKLGQALRQVGDVTGADGVLREALDLTGPRSQERPRLYVALAEVARRRERAREAARLLGLALAHAEEAKDEGLERMVHRALGELRLEEDDVEAAVHSFRRCVTLEADADLSPVARANTLVQLAESLLHVGERSEARVVLDRARLEAERVHADALVARCDGVLGALMEHDGDFGGAQALYREASHRAALAADAQGYRRWLEAADALAR